MDNIRLAYSIAEACRLSSIGRSTLYSAIKAGDLKTCKVGRRTLVTSEALLLWINSLPNSLGSNLTRKTISGERSEAPPTDQNSAGQSERTS
jgi:excisionase family DNA binding protein